MTSSNLPAVRTRAAIAVAPKQPARQDPAPTQGPAPLRLSTALALVSLMSVGLAALSLGADRHEQAALVAAVALVLLFAAATERHREYRS